MSAAAHPPPARAAQRRAPCPIALVARPPSRATPPAAERAARAARRPLRVDHPRAAAAGTRQRRHHPPRPRRQQHDRSASSTASSTSCVTRSTVRGSRTSAPASHRCSCARVSASSAPNGSSRHSTGRPASSVRRNATRWRIPPDSSPAARARSPRARTPRSARAPPPAPPPSTARDAQRQPGVVERAQPRQQPVALGHQRRRRRVDRPGVGRLQPAHELEQRRLPAPARPDDRETSPRAARASTPSSARTAPNDLPLRTAS